MSADNRTPLNEDAVLDALATHAPAPDLTGVIMGRLGFVAADPEVTRRVRRRRWRDRALFALAMGGVIGLGVVVHDVSPRARTPVGPTVPAALGNDVSRQHMKLQRGFQTIRNLVPPVGTPTPSVSPPAPPLPPAARPTSDGGELAIGPVRWL